MEKKRFDETKDMAKFLVNGKIYEKLEDRAREKGFPSVDDYVQALIIENTGMMRSKAKKTIQITAKMYTYIENMLKRPGLEWLSFVSPEAFIEAAAANYLERLVDLDAALQEMKKD